MDQPSANKANRLSTPCAAMQTCRSPNKTVTARQEEHLLIKWLLLVPRPNHIVLSLVCLGVGEQSIRQGGQALLRKTVGILKEEAAQPFVDCGILLRFTNDMNRANRALVIAIIEDRNEFDGVAAVDGGGMNAVRTDQWPKALANVKGLVVDDGDQKVEVTLKPLLAVVNDANDFVRAVAGGLLVVKENLEFLPLFHSQRHAVVENLGLLKLDGYDIISKVQRRQATRGRLPITKTRLFSTQNSSPRCSMFVKAVYTIPSYNRFTSMP